MELLLEIKDKDTQPQNSEMQIRESSRAILFDENDMVPLLFVSKYNFHKLPGGGIEENENQIEALRRECLEEVGSNIEIGGEVGQIIEFRTKWNIKQISYCYYGKIISRGEPSFTEKELEQGFQIKWTTLHEAFDKIKNDKPENYEGTFIQKRELEFLKKLINLSIK